MGGEAQLILGRENVHFSERPYKLENTAITSRFGGLQGLLGTLAAISVLLAPLWFTSASL